MRVCVTTGGRITIPKPMRAFLGMRPGTLVEFTLAAGRRAVMSRANGKPWRTPFGRGRGRRKRPMTTGQIMRLLRRDD